MIKISCKEYAANLKEELKESCEKLLSCTYYRL